MNAIYIFNKKFNLIFIIKIFFFFSHLILVRVHTLVVIKNAEDMKCHMCITCPRIYAIVETILFPRAKEKSKLDGEDEGDPQDVVLDSNSARLLSRCAVVAEIFLNFSWTFFQKKIKIKKETSR